MIGWDHPDTARYYDAFCAKHSRYHAANESLVWHARPDEGQRVLDLAAGTGLTTEAILPWLSSEGHVVAYEPAHAMRHYGRKRVSDPRVCWISELPEGPFDRIICGAAIWQMLPLERTLRLLADRLSDTGRLCFNIPSLYLGKPDEPGGGNDPNLFAIPSLLGMHSNANAAEPLPCADAIGHFLSRSGLTVRTWRFRQRITQEAYRDWLKIPVLTNHWFEGFDADERAQRIDRAFDCVDNTSWRWEEWSGWTASRGGAENDDYPAYHQSLNRGDHDADGYLYLPCLLDVFLLSRLRSKVEGLQQRLQVPPGAAHDDPRFIELQREVAVLPEWESLRRDPALLKMLREITGVDVQPGYGDVCRVVPAGAPASATPPHQDEFFMRNSQRTWTVWIPLADCPMRLGPLAILPGSHRRGVLPHSNDRVGEEYVHGTWAASSLSCGDVLVFQGRTVHRALPNLTRHTTRISADFRYSVSGQHR
jgi:SAM-dependent methyltransferase